MTRTRLVFALKQRRKKDGRLEVGGNTRMSPSGKIVKHKTLRVRTHTHKKRFVSLFTRYQTLGIAGELELASSSSVCFETKIGLLGKYRPKTGQCSLFLFES